MIRPALSCAALGLLLAFATVPALACDDDGNTADCPPPSIRCTDCDAPGADDDSPPATEAPRHVGHRLVQSPAQGSGNTGNGNDGQDDSHQDGQDDDTSGND